MALELVAGLGWLLTQTQTLSHIAEKLVDRFLPNRDSPLPRLEIELRPADPVNADHIRDRLLVPPPGRLLFVHDGPTDLRPVVAVVLAESASAGQVRWLVASFDVPIDLELPPNAIAVLPTILRHGPDKRAQLTLGSFLFTGTVDGYQVYLAA